MHLVFSMMLGSLPCPLRSRVSVVVIENLGPQGWPRPLVTTEISVFVLGTPDAVLWAKLLDLDIVDSSF